MLHWPAMFAVLAVATTVAAQTPPTAQVTRLACTADDLAEVEVTSAEAFPVRNALTELEVGGVASSLSRYADDGDTHTLIFSFNRDQLRAISADDTAQVRYNPSNGNDVWLIGPIDATSAVGCTDGDQP